MNPRSHFNRMKPLHLGVILLALSSAAMAQDSAYKALRTLASERGQSVLNKAIEVAGSRGMPQPVKWKILLDDPLARAGVREFEISGGRIVSERAPVRLYVGTGGPRLIDFSKLNLDSAGAFTVAEKEAVRARVGFDSVDYVLRTDEETGTPTWALRLLSSNRREVGVVFVAADSGRVVRVTGMRGGEPPGPEPGAARPRPRSGEPEIERRDTRYDDGGGVRGHLERFHQRMTRRLLRSHEAVQEFFTGSRNGRDYRDSPDYEDTVEPPRNY
jgi:hypothetical protein